MLASKDAAEGWGTPPLRATILSSQPTIMRYVSTSNLSTRAMEWVPVRDNDTQPSYEGKVARFSAVDLAGVYRDAAGYRFPTRCPVSGYAYKQQGRWGQG